MAVTLRGLLPCALRRAGAACDVSSSLPFAARSSAGLTAVGGANRGWASTSSCSRARRQRTLEVGANTLPRAVACPVSVSRVLMELFDMTADEGHDLLPHLDTVSIQTLMDTCSYLTERGVQKEQVLRIPWILLRDKGSIQMRLAVLLSGQTMFESAVHGLAFCQFALPKIRDFRSLFHVERLKLPHHRNRLYYMADKLGVPVPEMTEAISCIRGFGAISLEHILYIIEVISKLNVKSDNVLRDPWIFMENISLDSLSVQEFTVQYYGADGASHNPGIAGRTASLASLIQEDSFIHLIAHQKLTADRVPLKTASTVMYLLLREGYTITEILQNPRVLNFSVRRVSERLSLLRAAGLPKVLTGLLYYPDSRFDVCFNSLIRGRETKTTLLGRAPSRSDLCATHNQSRLQESPKNMLQIEKSINLELPPD